MVPLEKLAQITQRFQFLEARMAEGADASEIAALAKEYSDLKPVVEEIAGYRQLLDDIQGTEVLLGRPRDARAGRRRTANAEITAARS